MREWVSGSQNTNFLSSCTCSLLECTVNDPRWRSYSSVFSQTTLSQSCQSRTADSSLCSVPKLSSHALCLRGTSDPTLCRTCITYYATGIRISVAVPHEYLWTFLCSRVHAFNGWQIAEIVSAKWHCVVCECRSRCIKAVEGSKKMKMSVCELVATVSL